VKACTRSEVLTTVFSKIHVFLVVMLCYLVNRLDPEDGDSMLV
jgi:hypothetical protein